MRTTARHTIGGLLNEYARTTAVLALLLCLAPAYGAALKPYTMADDIRKTEITALAGQLGFGAHRQDVSLGLSPDGLKSVLVLRRGILETGRLEYSLVMFYTEDVLDFVHDRTRVDLPRQEVLLQMDTASSEPAFKGLTWLPDSRRLIFINRTAETHDIAQVFTLDTDTRRLMQLTHHPADVLNFNLASDERTLSYGALAPLPAEEADRQLRLGFPMHGRPLSTIIAPSLEAGRNSLFVLDLTTGRVRDLGFVAAAPTGAGRASLYSQSGRWAIVAAPTPTLPAHWAEYAWVQHLYAEHPAVRAAMDGHAPPSGRIEEDDAFGDAFGLIPQHHLADLTTGTSRPLLDVPAARGAGGGATFAWSPDGKSVALAASFLPLTGVSARERARRRSAVVMVEVDLASGRTTEIAGADQFEGAFVVGTTLEWDRDGTLRRRQFEESQTGTVMARTWRFRKQRGRWQPLGEVIVTPESASASKLPLTLKYKADFDTLGEIEATDRVSGASRIITDLSAPLRSLALGHLEMIEWSDRLDRQWTGGLLYPPDYEAGRRYPLVIQTYGVPQPGDFFFGSTAGGFAARALVNRGMLVLQLSCERRTPGVGENEGLMICYEAAIDALAARGLIDPERVGLVGFSRTGLHVQYAAAFSRHVFAAALISDSTQATLEAYVRNYASGARPVGMMEWDGENGFMGAPPFGGDGWQRWLERSPTFNLDRVRTPLRYEEHGKGEFPSFKFGSVLDTFAILRRLHRPVDYVIMPNEAHIPVTPWGRWTSQQGSVDWFDFWLNDRERTEPYPGAPETKDSLAQQYQRWRLFRAERDALRKEPRPPLREWTWSPKTNDGKDNATTGTPAADKAAAK